MSVETALPCDRCGGDTPTIYPALADWRDRVTAGDQRRAADGHTCDRCGRLIPQPTPLLQYRRGDVIGLVVGFPAQSDPNDDRQFIQDTLSVAHELDFSGAGVVVSARMAWWGSIYNRPLGPDLVAGLATPLPESAEETERWKAATVDALDLPDVTSALMRFVTADEYDQALDVVRTDPQLVDPEWRVTVRHLASELERRQDDADAAELVRNRLGRLRQIQLVGVEDANDTELTGDLAALVDAAINATSADDRRLALRHAVAALDQAPHTHVTAAAHISLVASLLADPDRQPGSHQEVLDAAKRAVAVAKAVTDPHHELTQTAMLNLAVAVEEDQLAADPAAALAESRSLLELIAPAAALRGSPLVADIATNLATIAAREGSRADNPERTRVLLDDASHLRRILTVEARRSELVALVDTAFNVALTDRRQPGRKHPTGSRAPPRGANPKRRMAAPFSG